MHAKIKLKIFIRENVWGNVRAFVGRRAIKSFGPDDYSANLWAKLAESKGHQIIYKY